jgi:hypothetical protein
MLIGLHANGDIGDMRGRTVGANIDQRRSL